MKAECYDCKLPYGDPGFADLVVAHHVWARLSPSGDGNGMLCPTCMCRRAEAAGLENVPATFRSGAFSDASSVIRLARQAAFLHAHSEDGADQPAMLIRAAHALAAFDTERAPTLAVRVGMLEAGLRELYAAVEGGDVDELKTAMGLARGLLLDAEGDDGVSS